MIVVISECGEYEQRYEKLHGVFDTIEQAEAAVRAATERSPDKFRLHREWDARRQVALATMEPERILKSPLFKDGEFRGYKNADYERAKQLAGDEPELGFVAERIYFYEVPRNNIRDSGYEQIKMVEPATNALGQ